jgi:hypothetical protein
MKTKDIVGVLAGAGVSIVGLLFAPRPYHGWGGICPWEMVFPRHGSLWPDPSAVMFDGCDNGHGYMLLLVGYLSLVFLIAGALASRIAERPSRSRGALINAVVLASTLVLLIIQAKDDSSMLRTLVFGVASVVGVAGIGLLGGLRAKPRA